MQYDVIIVGAGVAGLACAKVLQENQVSYIILEAGGRPGGRVQTDVVDGFQLDHGFQVLQTGYPDVGRYVDLAELHLHAFPAGVAVRFNGRFHTIADPRRHPRHLLSTAFSPVGSMSDRLAMLKLARRVCRGTFEDIFKQPETLTPGYLRTCGFSEKFVKSFFMPFLAGACLDKEIQVSSRVLDYLFRVFTTGDAALPARGMGEIPQQMVRSLGADAIEYNSRVVQVSDGAVTLEDGRVIGGKQVVVATPEPVLQELLGIETVRRSVAETCIYYSADWLPPFNEPFLLLNGDGDGPVNNIAFPSMVASTYAPAGETLIAVVVVDDQYTLKTDLESDVRRQCSQWFGDAVDRWKHLRTCYIEHALPSQAPPTSSPYLLPEQISKGIRVCGEYKNVPGLQWALMSGHMTGESLLESL